MKEDDSSELNEVLERVLATGCVACNASQNLCDCIGYFENGKRCCPLCEHLARLEGVSLDALVHHAHAWHGSQVPDQAAP